MKTQVFILELPSDSDLFEGQGEGFALARTLRVARIGAETRAVCSLAMLKRGLDEYLATCKLASTDEQYPVLHLSAHGNAKGIGLADETLITWGELARLLAPINQELQGNLDVIFSSCMGFNAISMAMSHEQRNPRAFSVLVGPNFEPTWGEALVGFAAFYFQLLQTRNLEQALTALRTASGHEGWHALSAANARELFDNQLRLQANPANLSS